ncbi:peptidase inhibitor family I36 protein [Streptomyces sp. NPDC090022]|uniref:peptidase inhibitor family I36 protein n=1 Tax=Streptomyces sp. NPDC090022 TaxID=3365920 RepID=UPI0038252EAB
MKLRSLAFAAAVSLTSLLMPTSASAAGAVPACPGGSVCFYSKADYRGQSWEWTRHSGYRDMPAGLHDHVGSFVAGTDACFINWGPKETRSVHNGDWRRDYQGDFGGRIDGVGPTC